MGFLAKLIGVGLLLLKAVYLSIVIFDIVCKLILDIKEFNQTHVLILKVLSDLWIIQKSMIITVIFQLNS